MSVTLKELCELYHISRRAIQGYEKAGLLQPTDKNDRGYLLYDEHAIQRAVRIRKMQHYGFTIKEIQCFLDAPPNVLKEELIKKLYLLEEKKENLEKTLKEIHELIDSLTTG